MIRLLTWALTGAALFTLIMLALILGGRADDQLERMYRRTPHA